MYLTVDKTLLSSLIGLTPSATGQMFRLTKLSFFIHNTTTYIHPMLDSKLSRVVPIDYKC